MPVLDPSRCQVRSIGYTTAARVITEEHYTHAPGPISVSLGMYVDGVLGGVLTYGTTIRKNAAAICGEPWADRVLELSRLFIYDWAGRNSESWFIGQSFRLLQAQCPDAAILLSYADSAHGHRGIIYQATNWLYTGASTKGGFEMADGTFVHARTLRDARRGATVDTAKPEGTRWVSCAPKHRYISFLGDKGQRRRLREMLRWPVLPYPKTDSATEVA